MDLHDYIIISQNKQDNPRLCTILDYHMACSDHDERVAKVGPATRITELEAKSKGKRRAARFFILHGVWRPSIIYCLLVIFNVHIRRPNASTGPLHVQPKPFAQSSCGEFLTLLQRFVVNITIRHYCTLQLTPQAQKKLNTTSRSRIKTISIRP